MQIRLRYCNVPNVGDIMNKVLAEKLFDCEVIHSRFYDAEMVGIGSILDDYFLEGNILPHKREQQKHMLADVPIDVWGTGFIHDYGDLKLTPLRPLRVLALRGELTRRVLERALDREIACPLGDPGLLAPKLLAEPVEKRYRIGIIPHYIEQQEEAFRTLVAHYPDSTLIDVTAPPLEVIRHIGQCECVLSSSLHGLIIADGFGIPNQWVELTDRVIGSGYKFRDYYSAFHLSANAIDINKPQYPSVHSIHEGYEVLYGEVERKQSALLDCFRKRDIRTE